uniref:PRA1 family protein n=1 Tax=Plectus sambesii TaxID=2011161 RepID=A0A914WUP1_9BILA
MQPIKVDLSGVDHVQNDEGQASGWFPIAHQLLPAKAEVAREWIGQRRAGMRGWRDFFKSDKFRLPSGPTVLTQRLALNIEHFQSNYLCVFVVLLIYCILTSPMLLLALAACLGMFYVIRVKNANGTLRIGGKELSPAFQYAIVAACSFPLFYISGAGSIIFWVI